MKLTIALENPLYADGCYTLKAKGCIAASLHWANEKGILPEWTALAYIPVTAGGTARFRYTGKRMIPQEATCVIARGIFADFSRVEECVAMLPYRKRISESESVLRFAVMSDIHMSQKAGRFMKALKMVEEMQPDAVLLAGDLTNDGLAGQFVQFAECLSGRPRELPVCCAAGNHDYPLQPLPQIRDGVCDYQSLYSWTLNRNRNLGCRVEEASCGASAVWFGCVEVITLNCVSHWRRFIFPEGAQLEWLRRHLAATSAAWRIILCHAPLWNHNPQRRFGYKEPYLSRDRQLQEIINMHQNIIFISGHTHISPNIPWGCVEFDEDKKNIYINDGSLCPNELKDNEPLMPAEWSDGDIMLLEIGHTQIRINSYLLHSGKKIARGCYVWQA